MSTLRAKIAQRRLAKAFMRATKLEMLETQGNRCAYCKDILSATTVTADHIYAKARGGTDSKENILAACYDCNVAKGTLRINPFKKLIKRPPIEAPWPIRAAHARRRLNKRVEKAEKRILASVGAPNG